MQDREPQLYTQASHSLLKQHNLKTKDDMKLPKKSHCISQQGYHRPVQLHCGKRYEHCHRTPHIPTEHSVLLFHHILTPCYTLLFSSLPLFSISIPQLLYQESLLPFSSHMLSTSILWKTNNFQGPVLS